eukprot:scaffold72590_cov21-Tisochrysis_lutea.AAC.2
MAATWLAEASWTTIQYLQQQLRPGVLDGGRSGMHASEVAYNKYNIWKDADGALPGRMEKLVPASSPTNIVLAAQLLLHFKREG